MSIYLRLRKKYRAYFWNKRWYKHLVLYKFRHFMGWSYLRNGWHTLSENDYLEQSLRRIENKL